MNEAALLINKAPLPIAYREAREALANCERIDECKDWSDRAMALASYARQAKDQTLFDAALRIQLRATERMGELLERIEPANGGDRRSNGGHPPVDSRKAAATEAGLSEHQAKQALRVVAVPQAERDALIEGPNPPTVTALADRGRKPLPERVKPDPYSAESFDWVFAIGEVAELPACGLDVLIAVAPRSVERMISDARTAVENLGAWVKLLEEKNGAQ